MGGVALVEIVCGATEERLQRQEGFGIAHFKPVQMHPLAFYKLPGGHGAFYFAGDEDGIVGGGAGVVYILGVWVGIEDQDILEGDCAGHLEVD